MIRSRMDLTYTSGSRVLSGNKSDGTEGYKVNALHEGPCPLIHAGSCAGAPDSLLGTKENAFTNAFMCGARDMGSDLFRQPFR